MAIPGKLFTGAFVKLDSIRKSEKAQGLVEYGLIMALVSIVVIVPLGLLGRSLETVFGAVADALSLAVEDPTANVPWWWQWWQRWFGGS